jgi:hypothetical protein
MPNLLVSTFLVLEFALAVALIRKYVRTRDAGFIWLGMAVVIWPLVARYGGRVLVDRLVNKQPIGFYPFTLVEQGQTSVGSFVYSLGLLEQLIGVGLLLVAVLYLCKTQGNPNRQATA